MIKLLDAFFWFAAKHPIGALFITLLMVFIGVKLADFLAYIFL